MHRNDRFVYIIRFRRAIKRIGVSTLLQLPKSYRLKLAGTTDLVAKVLLEEIADTLQ